MSSTIYIHLLPDNKIITLTQKIKCETVAGICETKNFKTSSSSLSQLLKGVGPGDPGPHGPTHF